MSLQDILKKKLSSDLFSQVEEALGDDFNYDLVPRTRLNKVISQRNALKEQLQQVDVTDQDDSDDPEEKPASKNETKTAEGKGTKNGYTQEDVDKLLQQKDDELTAFKIKQVALNKLQSAKALDADLVFNLLDASKLAFDDKGELTGLDEQLTPITTSKAFLFGDASGRVPTGTGKEGAGAGDASGTVDAAIGNIFSGYGVEI